MAGIVEPIKAGIRDPKLGVGKQEQDDFFTSEENVQRKKLEVEVEETEEHAKKREVCLWMCLLLCLQIFFLRWFLAYALVLKPT